MENQKVKFRNPKFRAVCPASDLDQSFPTLIEATQACSHHYREYGDGHRAKVIGKQLMELTFEINLE
jgi:hypothetical protein